MPGGVNPGRAGHSPSREGSPPMRTHFATDGVGPSKMNNMCHPGGETPASGGATMSQVLPLHLKAGKIVRAPIVFPWVLEVATIERLISSHRLDR